MSQTDELRDTPSLQRLGRLVARRANRRVASECGGDTPVPSVAEVESSLRRKHRAAQIIDDIVSQTRSRASSKTPSDAGRMFASTPQPMSQSPAAAACRRSGKTTEPYLRFKKAPTPHLPVEVDGPQPDLWATMARQAAEEAKTSEMRAKLERRRKIEEQRKTLDEQCTLRSTRAVEQRNRLIEERAELEKAAKDWASDRKAAADHRRSVAEKVKRDREEQALSRKQRRAADEAERNEQEANILDRIGVELEVERQRQQAVRDRDVQFKHDLIAANEQQKAIKAERQAKQAAEEASFVKLYDERLKKQEAARLEAWEAMKAKMQSKEAIAFNLQATLDDKAAEDERRAAIDTERRETAKARQLEAERAKRKQTEYVVRECQLEQIALKHAACEGERAHLAEETAEVAGLTKREQEEARREREQRAAAKAQQRAWLADQMRVRNAQQTVIMSDEEKRLNTALLRRSTSPDRD